MRHSAGWRLLLAALLLGLATPPALAADLDSAKAAGQVGERADGYLGLVDRNAPAPVRALVERVNQGRRSQYAQIAAKNGVPIEAVAARAGAKLIQRARPGEYVMDTSGAWKKK